MAKTVLFFVIIFFILVSFIQGTVSAVAETLETNEQMDSAKNKGSLSSSSSEAIGIETSGKYEKILLIDVPNELANQDAFIVYEFPEADNAITTITLNPLNNSGEIHFIVEVLEDRSSSIDTDAPGNVYQQMNIHVTNESFIGLENLENLEIGFKVEKSWMKENDIKAQTVNLYRYADESWTALSTSATDEDDEYVYFESQTHGFSHFAICSESENTQVITEIALKSTDDAIEEISLVNELPVVRNSADGSLSDVLITFGGITLLIVDVYALYRKRK